MIFTTLRFTTIMIMKRQAGFVVLIPSDKGNIAEDEDIMFIFPPKSDDV